MVGYVFPRILSTIIVVLGVSVLVFGMVHLLPGDAVSVMLAEFGASAEQQQMLAEQLGLNDPLPVQYWRFITKAVQGDLGTSLFTKRPVTQILLEQFPSTLQLALAATVVSVVLGVGAGMIAAAKRNSWMDTGIMFIALLSLSMPGFWLSIIFIFLFSLKLGWFPAAGSSTWLHLVLPAFALGIRSAGIIARMVRSGMLEVLRQDYMRTARAKGLKSRIVNWRHGLRNALIPVVTMIGIQFGQLLGGAVIAEIVFARRGVGDIIVKAIFAHDVAVVTGGVMFVAFTFSIVNLLVDLVYGLLDPRIRFS